jgi:hypothetical protein
MFCDYDYLLFFREYVLSFWISMEALRIAGRNYTLLGSASGEFNKKRE